MLPFDVNRCALILIDLQNDFCHPDGTAAKRGAIVEDFHPALQNMEKIFHEARKRSLPIIHVISEHSKWTSSPFSHDRFGRKEQKESLTYCAPGSWGAKIYEPFKPLENEKVLVKHRYSAFYDTSLALVLRAIEKTQIILIGLYTDV